MLVFLSKGDRMDLFLQILYTVLILGFLIFIHELGHFTVAKLSKIKVNEFSLGMGPAIFKKQGKQTLYSLRLLPIGGYVKMEGEDENSEDPDSFSKKPVLIRMAVVVAGAFMNILLGFIVTAILVSTSAKLPSVTVGEFTENALSQTCGLQVGDTITEVNGKKINIYMDLSAAFSRAYGKDAVDITVIRNGETVKLENVQFEKYEIAKDMESIYPDFKVYAKEKTFGNVIHETFFRTISFVTLTYESFGDIITGRASLKYVSGPVGTSEVIAQAAKSGWDSILYLIALITINLGVVNMLPLPALDGGRFVFLLIELIRGKPINQKYESVVHLVGMALLLILMVVITFKDIFFPIY